MRLGRVTFKFYNKQLNKSRDNSDMHKLVNRDFSVQAI